MATLLSRVLGMIRDIATASLFGVSAGGLLDAFVVALRIPDLFRRLFGEGTLAASYVPVLARALEQDREQARGILSGCWRYVVIASLSLVVVGEGLCGVAWWLTPRDTPLLGLMMLLLPYVFFICLTAQLAATLQVLDRFAIPALVPTIFNVCWLLGLVCAAYATPSDWLRVHLLAGSIVVAGLIQLALQWWALARLDFLPTLRAASDSLPEVAQIATSLAPAVLGLAVTQLNTFVDSILAWALSAPAPEVVRSNFAFPLSPGAAAVTYYGERIYMFPLGFLGIAMAIAVFPQLSRTAARGERQAVGRELSQALRLILWLALPASVGLVLLAHPLLQLMLQRGAFTAEDTARTARAVQGYAAGIWAFCALPLVIRGFYALGNVRSPARQALPALVVNVVLSLLLVWPWQEAGLAWGTSLTAIIQLGLLALTFSWYESHLLWRPLLTSLLRTILLCGLMGFVGLGLLQLAGPRPIIRLLLPLFGCGGVYLAASWSIGCPELRQLVEAIHQRSRPSCG
ncbi:MAG: murein biosynthesis integral membrane protein MurJ [Planctomycetales bacterium]|nr:murein biosynthesis integral membrane protein MurJ [Planctomycetales bacterium]